VQPPPFGSSPDGAGGPVDDGRPGVRPGDAEQGRGPGVEAHHTGVLPYPLKYLGSAAQLVLVTSRSWTGTQARLEAYENGPEGWQRMLGPVPARVGRTGMIPAERRIAGSGTTPAGTFPLSLALGLEPDPGTAMPYQHLTSGDQWWVGDPFSQHYNNLRSQAEGGFLPRESGRRASKLLAARPVEYAYAVVVDFNRPYPVRTRGAGVFLRVSNGLSTDGSVALEREDLLELLRWLDPERGPVITLAPERVVGQY
jgi:L,D-peptidoglycan transpeptidase YkuD (ErfK/YbiS/YcfS/YnhG family)